MIRSELVEKLSDHMDITKAEADRIVLAFCNAIKRGLQKGDKVMILNFGVFEIRPLAARVSHNAHSGINFNLPARTRPWFRPSRHLNRFVNNGAGIHEN